MKLEIGLKVKSSKLGLGTITKIITKSTGYVEVTYVSGKVNKEMAFNLTDENGVNLKEKKNTMKITSEQAQRNHDRLAASINYALSQETGRTGTTEFLQSI
jgi:LPS O-antigen subunit length determinant protein (WzzB/FepE family)